MAGATGCARCEGNGAEDEGGGRRGAREGEGDGSGEFSRESESTGKRTCERERDESGE